MAGENASSCGHANPPEARFCSICGASLQAGCMACGATLEPGAAFCSQCGAPTRPSAAASEPAVARAGERRHLTVLFCDLAGSTSLSSRLDPENHREVMEVYYEIVGTSVSENGGHVNAYMGDGVLAFFGYPIARDDSTHRAVRAGLAIQERIRARNATGGIAGEQIEARVGIHRGLVVIDETGIDSGHGTYATGEAMNVAARVQDQAARGEVVVTEDVAQLVTTAFKLDDRGEVELRGLEGRRRLFRVSEATLPAEAPARRSALVGRQAELELVRARWASVLESAHGQVLLVVGEPGIGKTRLVAEVAEQLGGVRGSYLAECSEYETHTPFALARSLLLDRLGCVRGSSPEVVGQALGALFDGLGDNADEGRFLLGALLQSQSADELEGRVLAPGEARSRLIGWLATALAAITDPTVIRIEDVQWADPSSLEVLTALLDRLAGVPVLLLMTARPEFEAPWPARSNRGVIPLPRLSEREVREMVANRLGKTEGLEGVLDAIVDRADGVPFFVEELARSVSERVRDVDWIPLTLNDSLLARLDRLGPDRQVAQAASVVGREFTRTDVALLYAEDDLDEALARLEEAEIIERTRGIGAYRFRHALVHDTAYASLLLRTRRGAHAKLAAALEARGGVPPERLARHFAEAQQPERASALWHAAAKTAMTRTAHAEGGIHLRLAIEQLLKLPESDERSREEMELQFELSQASRFVLGFGAPGLREPIERALALTEQVGDASQQVGTLYNHMTQTLSAGHIAEAREIAERIVTVAGRSGTPRDLMIGELANAAVTFNAPDFAATVRDSAAAIQYENEIPPSARSELQLARLYGTIGAYRCLDKPAFDAFHVPLQEAADRQANGEYVDLISINFALIESRVIRDADRTLELATRLDPLVRKLGLDFLLCFSDACGGWAEAVKGAPEQGARRAEAGLDRQIATGQMLNVEDTLYVLAEAQMLAGRYADAHESVTRGLDFVERPDPKTNLYLMRAKIWIAEGEDPDRIEEMFQTALRNNADFSPMSELRIRFVRARWLAEREGPEAALAGFPRPLLAGPEDHFPVVLAARAFVAECERRS